MEEEVFLTTIPFSQNSQYWIHPSTPLPNHPCGVIKGKSSKNGAVAGSKMYHFRRRKPVITQSGRLGIRGFTRDVPVLAIFIDLQISGKTDHFLSKIG